MRLLPSHLKQDVFPCLKCSRRQDELSSSYQDETGMKCVFEGEKEQQGDARRRDAKTIYRRPPLSAARLSDGGEKDVP